MSSWVQWAARAIILTAAAAAVGTGLSGAALAQTGVHVPGSVAPATGSGRGGNQTEIPVGGSGNPLHETGDPMTQCWGCALAWHGSGGGAFGTGYAAEAWAGRGLAEPPGPVIDASGSRCVCLRGPDAVSWAPPFIADSRPETPDRSSAHGSPVVGRPEDLLDPTQLAGRGDRFGQAIHPGRAVYPGQLIQPVQVIQPWQAIHPQQLIQPGLVNQIGREIETQTGHESQTGLSETPGPAGIGTSLARLPLAAKMPLAASLPPLAGLASLGGVAGLSRLASVHGMGTLPQAALLLLLAGASALKLVVRRRRGDRGMRRGAMTS